MVDFAGGPYLFEGLSEAQRTAVFARFGERCRSVPANAAAAARVRVLHCNPGEFREIELRGWTYTFDLDCQPRFVRLAGLNFMGRLEWTPTPDCRLWTSSAESAGFPGIFENFLRVLACHRVAELGGVILHSAAVVDRNRGYVFFGHSGAGKSTISRLAAAAGRQVLSDDLNALLPEAGRVLVHKIPFAGDFGQTAELADPVPLRALCRIEKGAEVCRQELARAVAVASLLACSPCVNVNPHWIERVQDNLEGIARTVPVAQLFFCLDSPFDAIVRAIET